MGEVRATVEFTRSGTEARGHDGHRRKCAEAAGQAGHECRTGWGGELQAEVEALGGDASKKFDHGRRRVRDDAVRGTDHAEAHRDRRARDGVDLEKLERRAGTDDINDCVDPADLMEVDLVWRAAVEPSFRLGQRVEDGVGAGLHSGWQPGFCHQPLDVGRRPHDGAFLGPDVNFGASDSASEHRFRFRGPPADREMLEHGQDPIEVRSGIDQGPESHVAGHTGEAVEPGNGHVAA